jgi:hypothetical protein
VPRRTEKEERNFHCDREAKDERKEEVIGIGYGG